MKSLLRYDICNPPRIECSLPETLAQVLRDSEFANINGLLTFKGSSGPTADAKEDLTGAECLLNKWQMDDFAPTSAASLEELANIGFCFARALQERVSESRVDGNLRIIVSANPAYDESLPDTCTVYLHQLRSENPWLDEDWNHTRGRVFSP